LEMADGGKGSTICGAMHSPTSKTPMPKMSLKKVEEVLLADRLGLHDEWVERWEQDGQCLEESVAPGGLPPFIRATLRRDKVYDVEGHIKRLVEAGCRPQVLYFCLEELSPNAEAIRHGRQRQLVPGIDGEFNLSAEWTEIRKLATREDLHAVGGNAEKTRRLIRGHRRELLLVADTNEFPLPRGIMTEPEDAADALSLLAESLSWVSKLAGAYTKPYEETLLKSKGLLFLTAYVLAHAGATKVRGLRRVGVKGELADLASLVTKKRWRPSDLCEKLRKFEQAYPRLHKVLMCKLGELHGYHAGR
jgi:hypothetical protein